MPNRIIRAGINSSERVNQLDAAEEVFYRRLLNAVDDHGLFDARPAMLRATLFPLRLDRVREADISRWTAACQKAGLIVLYAVNESSGSRRFLAGNPAGLAALDQGEKPYLHVLNTQWKARSEPKCPHPPPLADRREQLRAIANNDAQLPTDDNNGAQLRPYSETNTESETETGAAAARSPFEVYRSVYGKDAPIHHQEAIEAAGVEDLAVWRECVSAWKANGYSERNISGLLDSYRQRKDRQAKKQQADSVADEPAWRPPVVAAPENFGKGKPREGMPEDVRAALRKGGQL